MQIDTTTSAAYLQSFNLMFTFELHCLNSLFMNMCIASGLVTGIYIMLLEISQDNNI